MLENSPEGCATLLAGEAPHFPQGLGVGGFHFCFGTGLGDGFFKPPITAARCCRRLDPLSRQEEHQTFFKPSRHAFRAQPVHREMGQLMPQGLVQDPFAREQLERLQRNGFAVARGSHPSRLSRGVDELLGRGPGFDAQARWQNLSVRAQFLAPLFERPEGLFHPRLLGGGVEQFEVLARRNRVGVIG